MIATTALNILLTTSCSHVHIVLPNATLLARDQSQFADYFSISSRQSNVTYHSALDFQADSEDVVLVDEADHFVLGEPAAFQRLT